MNSLRISVRRAGSVFAAAALLLGTALPGIASAAQLTERSIELSSSAADVSGVTYNINFTATQDAGAVVVEFCANSPLLTATCDSLPGFDINTGTSVSGGFTKGTSTATKLVVTGSIDHTANSGKVTIPVTGVHNPTAVGSFYARIVTYTNSTGAAGYTSANPDAAATHLDDGGVALSTTRTIAVSGAVLESLQFCVAGEDPGNAGADPIGANCSGATNAPTLKLGKDTAGIIALDPDQIYQGTIYTQLSTNAVSGAVVSLKSSTAGCGGLMRAGETDPTKGCSIAPAGATAFTAGQAKFGVKLGTAVGVGTSNGTYQAYGTTGSTNYYNSSDFKLKFTALDASGVTSTYGDPILDTDSKPLNNMNMPVIFGASAAQNTPAGNYSAQLSLVATGKF